MPAIGIALLWIGYSAGLYGYSLVRGYCNSPAGLLNPLRPVPWSTTIYTGPGIIPSGCGGSGSSSSSPASSSSGGQTYQQSVAGEGGNPIQQTGGTVAGGHGR